MLPFLLSEASSAGGQITLPEAGVTLTMDALWTSVTSVVTNFITGVLTPVIEFITGNPLTLIFLGISFIGIGIRYTKRITYAFGRGR